MKLIVIISLFLYIGCSPSKNIAVPQDISTPDTNGILSFNQLTNAADFAILDSNPALAVELYRQAFAKNEVGYIMPYQWFGHYFSKKEATNPINTGFFLFNASYVFG